MEQYGFIGQGTACWFAAEIGGLPYSDDRCHHPVFAFHIHEGTICDGDMHDPFSGTMSHYNPADCEHPFHAGDLPPLFSKSWLCTFTISDRSFFVIRD